MKSGYLAVALLGDSAKDWLRLIGTIVFLFSLPILDRWQTKRELLRKANSLRRLK
jgi:hypothetical protein